MAKTINWNNYRISTRVAFLEHILVLRQLFEFISMSIFKHLPTWFWDNYLNLYQCQLSSAFTHLVLRQLLEFISMSTFKRIYPPGFETITWIHINVNFQALRNKTRFFDTVKYKVKIMFFDNFKIIIALRNQNINTILYSKYRFNYKCGKLVIKMRKIK